MQLHIRDYDAESVRQEGVENFYRTNHINQSYDFVSNLPKTSFDDIPILPVDVYQNRAMFNRIEFDPLQVKRMREEYGKLDKVEMSIWEGCELLNDVVDESDPDLDEPQIEHLLQTAEAIRRDYPDEDWLHLTGLIHGMCYCFTFNTII